MLNSRNPHLIFTGIRSIYGAYICGDSCDLNHDSSVILTGSYRTSDTLQMWDFGSGKLIHTVSLSNF